MLKLVYRITKKKRSKTFVVRPGAQKPFGYRVCFNLFDIE